VTTSTPIKPMGKLTTPFSLAAMLENPDAPPPKRDIDFD
jgi:hypothetical protein